MIHVAICFVKAAVPHGNMNVNSRIIIVNLSLIGAHNIAPTICLVRSRQINAHHEPLPPNGAIDFLDEVVYSTNVLRLEGFDEQTTAAADPDMH